MHLAGTRAVTAAVAVLLLTVVALATPPRMINYQGRLQNDSGNPLDTTVTITFAIYDDSTGGNLKWSETIADVEVVGGLFNVILGEDGGITDTAFYGPDRFLGIAVGGDPEMRPRTRFTAVPYAYFCVVADAAVYAFTGPFLNGKGNAGYVPMLTDTMTIGNSVAYQQSSKLGINTTSPTAALHVTGGSGTVPVLQVESFNSTTLDPGAPVVINAGRGGPGGAGGPVSIAGGNGGTYMGVGAAGGNVTILGGNAGDTPSPGGDVRICGGVGYGIVSPADGDVILAVDHQNNQRGKVGVRNTSPFYNT